MTEIKKNNINIKVDENGNHYFDLMDFSSFIDIKLVSHYELIVSEDKKSVKIRFFDKSRRLIKVID